MHSLTHRHRQAFEPMSPRAVGAVLSSARALQRSAQAGTTQPLLRGKNIALMCEAADDADVALFCHAVSELGGHLAHIRPSLSEFSTAQEVQHTGRMLGRLYDAVECQGITAALVARVGDAAGVPVYDSLTSARHPSACIAGMLGGNAAPADNRRFVLQAVLLGAIA